LRRKAWYSLYDRILHESALKRAFRKVKSANGAPGIDGQSCKDFAAELDRHILDLLNELKRKTYQPQPVKRVEIEKPDGGIRLIGIPTVASYCTSYIYSLGMLRALFVDFGGILNPLR
jgi:RNA-directed DNA polymerase